MSKKIDTITGKELMDKDLPPTRRIVERFLPQGLHILAGAPKVGKSWLTLWLCLQVAKGEPVWGMPTEKGTTLYLCLEDSLNRIQERLSVLTDDAPSNIHFATMAETINGGIVTQLEEFIAENPDVALIAIDTLQCIRNASGDMNVYAADYRDINLLKEITKKYHRHEQDEKRPPRSRGGIFVNRLYNPVSGRVYP